MRASTSYMCSPTRKPGAVLVRCIAVDSVASRKRGSSSSSPGRGRPGPGLAGAEDMLPRRCHARSMSDERPVPPSFDPLPEDWQTALFVVAHPDDIEYGSAAAVAR